jgi:hypothetical protein
VNEEEGQCAVPDCVVGVVDNVQVGAVHTLSECTKAETRVPTIVGAPNSEVLPTTTAAVGTESSTLSFGWAMENRGFIEETDGLYYDREEVRYCCSGEEEQYTYE